MIEGLKVTVPGSEVHTLVNARAKYHRDRAAAYRSKLTAFDDVDEEAMTKLSNDPATTLRQKAESHENSAEELEFVAKWLNIGEKYLLSSADLRMLGVVKSHW